ncbi:MAG: ABC transporter ATP-binding protein [Treponema sp.]|nr:ABC transporter ATP-binding protein [Treponema sp.]
MIQVSHFSKSYIHSKTKNAFAVEDISFTAKDASITGLLGKNGAGKTTIIKAICGFHYPTSGSIFIKTDAGLYDCACDVKLIHSIVGYVPEQPVLCQNLTVQEFLSMVLEMHNLNGGDTVLLQKVVDSCNLESVMHKKIRTLSKGFKQRVSVAQALVYNPPVLVLDEPTSGLDPVQKHEMYQLITSLGKTKTVLLSTHNLHEVEELCSSICILHSGHIVFEGTPDAARKQHNSPTLDEAFLHIINES